MAQLPALAPTVLVLVPRIWTALYHQYKDEDVAVVRAALGGRVQVQANAIVPTQLETSLQFFHYYTLYCS
jgi:long-subunit acyl-CoA synthetase (AMP-forming)